MKKPSSATPSKPAAKSKTPTAKALAQAPVITTASAPIGASFSPVSDIQLAQLKIEWVDRATIRPNTYNPNKMTWNDRMLLRASLLEDGWTQPIVTLPDRTIVDGEQRWTTAGIETTVDDIQEIIDRMEKRQSQGAIVSESVLGRLWESKRRLELAIAEGLPPCIASITGGLVPITTINLTDEAHRMISTIRHNRARGSHKLDSMATIITDLEKMGLDIEDLEKRLGMDDEEIGRLTKMAEGQVNALRKQLEGVSFSASWKPEHVAALGVNAPEFDRSKAASAALVTAQQAVLARQQAVQAEVLQKLAAQAQATAAPVTSIDREKVTAQVEAAIPRPVIPEQEQLIKFVFFVRADEAAIVTQACGSKLAETIVHLCRSKLDSRVGAA